MRLLKEGSLSSGGAAREGGGDGGVNNLPRMKPASERASEGKI